MGTGSSEQAGDPPRGPGRRPIGDAGAAAVEFALLAPLFFVLLFGMISAGTVLSQKLNVSDAAEQTARYGSTLSIDAAGGLDAWLRQVYARAGAAAGQPADASEGDPFGGYSARCVAYVGPVPGDGRAARHLTGRRDAPPTPDAGPCPGASARPASLEPYVEVTVRRDTSFAAVLFAVDITVTGHALSPFDAVADRPAGTATPPTPRSPSPTPTSTTPTPTSTTPTPTSTTPTPTSTTPTPAPSTPPPTPTRPAAAPPAATPPAATPPAATRPR